MWYNAIIRLRIIKMVDAGHSIKQDENYQADLFEDLHRSI